MDTNHIAQVLQDKKLQKHLNTKINRQFKTCRYIGDIVISEDEYIILKAYLRSICRKYLNTSERYITSPIFAVALVQIGIHKYDGRFCQVNTRNGLDAASIKHSKNTTNTK